MNMSLLLEDALLGFHANLSSSSLSPFCASLDRRLPGQNWVLPLGFIDDCEHETFEKCIYIYICVVPTTCDVIKSDSSEKRW